MARNLFKFIDPKKIATDSKFLLRYQFEDEGLQESVAKQGVLVPLLLSSKEVLIAGHRRFNAALLAGIKEVPVQILAREPEDEIDCLRLFFHSNYGQTFSEFEAGWILKKCSEMACASDEFLIDEAMPLLGLQGSAHKLSELTAPMGLDPTLLSQIESEQLPLRGSKVLLRFSAADQRYFAQNVSDGAQFSVNQLMQIVEWLRDLIQLKGVSLAELFELSELKSWLQNEKLDRRQKADALVKSLRRLRNPSLSEKEAEFEVVRRALQAGSAEVQIEVPPYFEAEGYSLKVKLKKPGSIDDLESFLRDQRKMLNSLFDIVL